MPHWTQRLLRRAAGALVLAATGFAAIPAGGAVDRAAATQPAQILTPHAGPAASIHGPKVLGVRPGHPLIYTIPATGDRPMTFSAEHLPGDIALDEATGRLSGTLPKAGEYNLILHARNAAGESARPLKIVVGDTIALTPPMGWNHYNAFSNNVDQKIIKQQADAMVSSGLINHGWTYINIDDSWQGQRSGPDHALQPNAKYPDMKGLCTYVHGLGLKTGIYSTPWVTSYAGHAGGSAENPDGAWSPPTIPKKGNMNKKILPWAIGRYSFAKVDANQFSAWGFDYLKYDWSPIETPEVKEMYDALAASGRDIVFSLSNSAVFSTAQDWTPYANCWRTTGDIRDDWKRVSQLGFSQSKWAKYARPGHWNDPDMLVVGTVGWGHPRASRLTPDEQYAHISLWCLVSSPLLLGCDLTKLDNFTMGLLTNDEVIDVDQDALGKGATRISQENGHEVWAKPLADGTWAVGLFNLTESAGRVTLKLDALQSLGQLPGQLSGQLSGKQPVRDLWREQDLPEVDGEFSATVASHGVVLVKIGSSHAE